LLLLQIHPNPQFDAEAAAQELRDSMKGLGNKRHLFITDRLIIIARCTVTQSAARGEDVLLPFLSFFPRSSLSSTLFL